MKSHHWSYFASFTLATIGLTGLSVPARSAEWIPIPAPAATPAPSKVLLPASRDFNAPAGLPARPLFDNPVRDPHILHAPDGYF